MSGMTMTNERWGLPREVVDRRMRSRKGGNRRKKGKKRQREGGIAF